MNNVPDMSDARSRQLADEFRGKRNAEDVLRECLWSQDDLLLFPVPYGQHEVRVTSYWC